MTKIYEADYAGHTIRFSFIYNETKRYFHTFLRPSGSDNYDIRAEEQEVERVRRLMPEDVKPAYAEYRSLISRTAEELLKYGCCIFHSVSFIFKGRVFLLTGPSGVGKSTQYFNWQALCPGEITMISGDMPVLESRRDGSIWIFPTSWNGKENIGNRISGRAAGIILLEQGDENRINRLTVSEAVLPILQQFLVRPETETQIYALEGIADNVLRSLPVWKMVNTGDSSSTLLLRGTLFRFLDMEAGI